MRPFPNILQALGLIVLVWLFIIFIAVPITVLAMMMKISILENPLTIAVINSVAIGVVLFSGLKITKAPFNEVFQFAPIRIVWLLPMSLTVIGMSILLSEADNWLRSVLPMPAPWAAILQNVFGSPKNFWGSFLTLVIVAPLTEELLFRGLILRGFLAQYSARLAIVISAILFGVFHFNPWQFTGAMVLGAVFAWWFVKTRSLLPCLFGHALTNGLNLIPLVFPQLQIPGYSVESTNALEFQPLWFDLLGLILAGTGMWLLTREFGKVDTKV